MAPSNPQVSRIVRLNLVSPNQISGFIEALMAAPYKGKADLPDIAYEQEMEVDELYPIAEAIQLLGLGEVDGGDIHLTDLGKNFADGDLDERKQIFSRSLMSGVPLAAHIYSVLRQNPGRGVPPVRFLDELEDEMSEDDAEETLKTVISWARFADLFSYDDDNAQFFLEGGYGDQPGVGGSDWHTVAPVQGVPSPFKFGLSTNNKVTAKFENAGRPRLPFSTSERDHSQRLEACRVSAADLLSDLQGNRYQARTEYAASLKKYVERLPSDTQSGNVLLADMQARTLRNLFEAESDILAAPFAAHLKTFLEQHIGLRPFYPEIAKFYQDVHEGHLTTPLPLDAVDAFARAITKFTPDIFEPNVSSGLAEAAEEPALEKGGSTPRSSPSAMTVPPPDPLGELDPHKSHDFAAAGAVNNLWQAFLAGEKINKAVEGWSAAGRALGPHAHEIIAWLRNFIGPHIH